MDENSKNEIELNFMIQNKTIIRLFGDKFVENNKDNIKLIIDTQTLNLCSSLDIYKDIIKLKNKHTLNIKLKIIKQITNISHMFEEVSTLLPSSNFSNFNTKNISDMSNMFYKS